MKNKRVKVQVINGDLEIKKYVLKKRLNSIKVYLKDNADAYAKCFAFGAGIATVYIIRNELL